MEWPGTISPRKLPTKIDPKTGTIRVYDPLTNEFGTFRPDGAGFTYFKWLRLAPPATWVRQQQLDGWARASVRVIADRVDEMALPPGLAAIAEVGRTREVLVLPVDNTADALMHDLLARVTEFLLAHEPVLAGLPRTHFDVFLSWTPKSDQESAIVPVELVEVLARLRGSIYLDTYC